MILQTRCLPRWLRWAGLALLWFVAVSVVLVLRAGEARAIETEALAPA